MQALAVSRNAIAANMAKLPELLRRRPNLYSSSFFAPAHSHNRRSLSA